MLEKIRENDLITNSGKTLTVYRINHYKDVWLMDELGDIRKTTYTRARKGTFVWSELKEVAKESIKPKIERKKVFNPPKSPKEPLSGDYYVYGAYHNGKLVYIGSGKGDRYKHCISGVSHNLELNRLFFLNEYVSIEKLKRNMSKKESLKAEYELINKFSPPFNRTGKAKESERAASACIPGIP